MKTVRVLLTDDHVLVRAGIRSLLEKMSGIEVVAEARGGYEALELTKKHFPNVVLMARLDIHEVAGLVRYAMCEQGWYRRKKGSRPNARRN